ncbi:hypothetical protein BO221_33340 [Archangium sp. Cb G35]|nr:hypothetical protein BO221_33340 [Archangium sp. Cb G35]
MRGLGDEATIEGFTGQVAYGVPFELPRGVGGFAPGLGLSYSGELGNGTVGVGWALPGVAIRRSLRLGVPAYGAADELELVGVAGGGRLVGLTDGTWRLESRGQAVKVERSGDGFVVTENGGVRYRLGTTAGARLEESGKTAAWYVEEITHPTGQRVALGYQVETGQVYLTSMAWGPSDAMTVELVYEARPDKVVSYRTGFRVETGKRLKEVRVNAFAQLLRTYVLSYDNTFALSRLQRVKMTGKGGVGALPELSFTYAQPDLARVVKQTGVDGWILNTRGVSLADVDGDGMADLLRVEAAGHFYRKGNGSSFSAPIAMSGPSNTDLTAVRLMDVNGDARPDLVRYLSEAWKPYNIEGNSFVDMGAWPGSDTVSLTDATNFFADLNGDGRVDVVKVVTSGLRVKLSGAGGLGPWVTKPGIGGSSTLVPGPNVRFHDVNGDGVADVVQLTDSLMRVYLGKGDGSFVLQGSYNHPWGTGSFPLADVRLCDLNRDGLMDVVRLSAGYVYWYAGKAQGGVQTEGRLIPRPGSASYDAVVAIGDVNGNGSEDVVWSSQEGLWALDMAGPTSAGMLTGMDNGMGKTVAFEYSAAAVLSAQAEVGGNPWTKKLPASIPVPVKLEVQPGAGASARVTEYSVRDGFWDGVERRFGGFLISTKRTLGASAAETLVEEVRYHAGLGADSALRGLPLEVSQKSGTGTVYTVSNYSYEARPVAGLPDVALLRVAAKLEARTKHYEGVATPLATLTTYTYDTHVRPIEEKHFGRLDVTGDEKTLQRSYASDASTWVHDKVCEEKVLEADGTLVSHGRVFYGDSTTVLTWTVPGDCQVGRGLVRENHAWLADAVNPRWVLMSATEYDAWDNPTRLYEKGSWRTLVYDSYHLYPITESMTPATGQTLTWGMEWDYVLGRPWRMTDASGDVTEMGYDTLGRLSTVALGGAEPHVRYVYDWTAPRPRTFTYSFDGAPEALAGSWTGTWSATGGWRELVAVSNGAGEALYSATRLLSNRWIVSGWQEHNARGQVAYHADAFYWDDAVLPTTRPAQANVGQTLAHDALGRLITQTLPTGVSRTLQYKAFELSRNTQEMAPVISRMDGLGRIMRTQRTVEGVVESVDAVYDAADRIHLLKLQDGAVTHRYDYDSLGRLVSAQDPDIGPRAMRYTDSGWLTHHTNGANQTRQFFYDDVGRLTQTLGEDGATFVYHYDTPQDGNTSSHTRSRLAWVQEPRGEVHFTYDAMGRVVRERRAVDGTWAEEVTGFSPSGLPLYTEMDGVRIPTAYDAAARAIQVGNYWQALQLDAAGRVLEEQYGNGLHQEYEWDETGLARRLQVLRGSAALYDVTLTRNAYGALKTVKDEDGVGLEHSAVFEYDGAARLTDVILGAQKQADGTLVAGAQSHVFGYGYDGLQNLTSRTATSPKALGLLQGSYHYGERGYGPRQLSRVSSSSGDTLVDHDSAGRQVRLGNRTMVYNGLDQLVQVKQPGEGGVGEETVSHAYGYDGLRTVTGSTSGATQYWYFPELTQKGAERERYVKLGDRTLAKVTQQPSSGTLSGATRTGSGEALRGALTQGLTGMLWGGLVLSVLAAVALRAPARARWQRLVAGTLAVALVGVSCDAGLSASSFAKRGQALWSVGETVYFHQGIAAGPVMLTRQDGSVLEERRYEPFGAPIDAFRELPSGSTVGDIDHQAEPLNVLNKQTDAHTGWSYHGARWMAPETTLWLTPDPPVKAPSGKFLEAPWDLHPYQFVRQNPVLYWDPDGQDVYLILWAPDEKAGQWGHATIGVTLPESGDVGLGASRVATGDRDVRLFGLFPDASGLDRQRLANGSSVRSIGEPKKTIKVNDVVTYKSREERPPDAVIQLSTTAEQDAKVLAELTKRAGSEYSMSNNCTNLCADGLKPLGFDSKYGRELKNFVGNRSLNLSTPGGLFKALTETSPGTDGSPLKGGLDPDVKVKVVKEPGNKFDTPMPFEVKVK